MAKNKEIKITFWNGAIESVENIPRGQSVITRHGYRIYGNGQGLFVLRWHFDGSSEELYKGPFKSEDWKGMD